MPTLRGWLVAGTGTVAATTGRFLAATELERLGLALVALVVIALVVVRRSGHDLEVRRDVVPLRPTAGMPVRVTLDVTNKGRGAAPLLLLEDRLPRGVSGRARFVLDGIEPGGESSTGYDLQPHRRGRLEAGPLTISFLDPFGLARVRAVTAPAATFLVRPAIERLALPRDSGRHRSAATSSLRQPVGSAGEDFYTLREYVEGDDLRKVHWASTAKRGRFTIRQEETPWHTTATILVDDRNGSWRGSGGGPAFERALEIAGSLVDLYQRTGYTYRLAFVSGGGIAARKGAAHRDSCLDLLATVEPSDATEGALARRLGDLQADASPAAALIYVGGVMDEAVTAALGGGSRRWQEVTAVCLPPHRWGDGGPRARWGLEESTVDAAAALTRAGVRTVVMGPGETFVSRWAPARTAAGKGGDGWQRKPAPV